VNFSPLNATSKLEKSYHTQEAFDALQYKARFDQLTIALRCFSAELQGKGV
jgi:hypothetical protein